MASGGMNKRTSQDNGADGIGDDSVLEDSVLDGGKVTYKADCFTFHSTSHLSKRRRPAALSKLRFRKLIKCKGVGILRGGGDT